MTMKTAEDAAAAAAPGSEAPGLSLLRAELEVLSILMPGLVAALPGHLPPTEAEVEAGFDNMPV